ncbi:hypothetical protein J3D55_003789 [Chryseobacterium ginsenosidimutans]|uniref:DUF5977 domain-containing protein n=1 Tax=Chryseobacterium ginsenosidimutans TaxID=687846 RepID=UPI0021697FD9|nr:DUF5977 domain-containing protein [Chryseobacterium ginsenosidimutans]MCS3870873.1 hypothetical protein [Chryseobacterium ginsenosidimutans]
MKKIKLIIVLLLVISSVFKSQTLEDNILQKKVKTSNSNNIGKVELNIPLYDISLPGYSFSASLEYLQERLIAEAQKNETTIVGTNWNLNSTGKIVISNTSLQNVRSPQMSHWSPDGFFSAQYDNCLIPQTTSTVSKKQILENPNSNLTTYEPNTFYFDFMGNKGYFVYDNVGNFLVNSGNDVFQIAYNGSKCHDVFSPINEFPEIIIKDSKGNQFFFGGDYNSTDVNFFKTKYDYYRYYDNGTFVTTEQFFTNKHVNYLSTLYLKKIKLANNKIIDFFYKNSNKSILDSFTNGGVYINANYNSNNNIPSNTILLNNNTFLGGVSGSTYTDTGGTTAWTNTTTTNNSYTKFAILDSIKVSDVGTLNFSYTQLSSTNTKPFLKKIELKRNNKTIKKIDFSYLIKGDYTYLNAFTINDELYGFDYYDYLGSSNTGGLLKKITYPTKGWDEFIYEGHNASKVYTTYLGYNESEAIVNQNPPVSVSGERIKEIRTYSNFNAIPLIKKYNYNGDNGISSGISSSSTVDVQYSKVTEEITGKEKNEYYFTDIITNPDSIATKKFSGNPNTNLSQILNNKLPLKISKSNERGKVYKSVKYNANNAPILTQYIKYTNFLQNANPISEISNTCTTCKVSDDRYYIYTKSEYVPNPSGSAPYYFGFYQYQPVLPYLPSSIRTVETLPVNANVQGSTSAIFDSQKFMKYNISALYWHPQVIETTQYLPYPWDPSNNPQYTGKKMLTKTYYAQDLIRNTSCVSGNCPSDTDQVGGKLSIYKYMVDNNILAPVIEAQTNAKGKSSLIEYQYMKNSSSSNLLQLSSQRKSLLNSVFTLNTPSSAEVEEKIAYQLYDNVGNLLQSKTISGVPITKLYGYKQSLPIIEIKGMTYGQIMQAFNLDPNDPNSYLQLDIIKKSDLDKDDLSENNFISELNNFRSKTELKDFEITSYVYDPLIGVKTIIKPAGITENYKYDSSNRLERILNSEGNILKEYKYHYAPSKYYSKAVNKTFTKNDCPTGMISSSITYSVPEGKYVSIIDQADADQQAENEGQNYANSNLTCYYPYCDFNAQASSLFINVQYAPFQKVNNVVNAQVQFVITSNQGVNWSDVIQFGNIPAPCRPLTTITKTSGNWQITIYQGSGQTVLRWLGSGSPSTGTTYNVSFNYNVN